MLLFCLVACLLLFLCTCCSHCQGDAFEKGQYSRSGEIPLKHGSPSIRSIYRFYYTSTTTMFSLGGLHIQVPMYINYYCVSLGWSLYTGSTVYVQYVVNLLLVNCYHCCVLNCILTCTHVHAYTLTTYIHTSRPVISCLTFSLLISQRFLVCSSTRRAHFSMGTSSILFSASWGYWTVDTSALRPSTSRPSRTC